jgi:hypothetical protein
MVTLILLVPSKAQVSGVPHWLQKPRSVRFELLKIDGWPLVQRSASRSPRRAPWLAGSFLAHPEIADAGVIRCFGPFEPHRTAPHWQPPVKRRGFLSITHRG